MQTWRLILNGPANAAANMAIDEAIAMACRQGHSPPTLRLYSWHPPALSVGYFQNIEKEIDLGRCKSEGYGLVRRATGGKAVLHDQEITYSVSARTDNPLFPKDLGGTFLVIARAFIHGLQGLGIRPQVFGIESQRRRPDAFQGAQACFATAMGFEIGVERKKLIGSAQRRWKDGFLQHGSLLLEFHSEKLFKLLKFSDEEKRQQAMEKTSRAVTSLCSLLQRNPDPVHLKEMIIKGFEETLKIRLVPSQLTSSEKEAAQILIQRKYGNDDWNLQRSAGM
jgi:lipoate-protein ligase A